MYYPPVYGREMKSRRYRKKPSLRWSKKQARKAAKRRAAARKRQYAMGLPVGGFPKSKMIKLRYVEEINLNPTTGNIVTNAFSANGMYDPNITGTGHQPSNYDIWMGTTANSGLYDHYCVLGSRITVEYHPTSTNQVVPAYMGVLLSDTGTRVSTLTGVQDLFEQRLVKRSRADPGLVQISNKPWVSCNFSARKFFGKSKQAILGDDEYRGVYNANPSDQAYFELYAATIGGNDPGNIHCLVTIEYVAVLSEPRVSQYS